MAKPVALIVSETEDGVRELLNAINKHGAFDAMSVQLRMLEAIVSPERHSIVVMDCVDLDGSGVDRVLRISAKLENATLIVFAQSISLFAYRKMAHMKNLLILQKPFVPDMFYGVLDRLVTRTEFEVPRFPRFITDEPARLVVLKTGLLIPTRMKNYSAGGAFLEYKGISLKVGDTIQVSVGMPDTGRPAQSLQLKARVAWINEGDGPRSASRGVGIQFLDN